MGESSQYCELGVCFSWWWSGRGRKLNFSDGVGRTAPTRPSKLGRTVLRTLAISVDLSPGASRQRNHCRSRSRPAPGDSGGTDLHYGLKAVAVHVNL